MHEPDGWTDAGRLPNSQVTHWLCPLDGATGLINSTSLGEHEQREHGEEITPRVGRLSAD